MTIKLGILSTAHNHSDAYAEALKALEIADLVAVADEDEERGRKFAEQHDIEYGSRAEILEQIDAGIVTAANANHLEWTEAAAKAGVHVLCEKPLATTEDNARAMVRVCESSGVILGVAMPVRFSEPARLAKTAVENGEIGELQAIIGTNILMQKTGGDWMTDPERSGGGAIMDHTVHIIDLARWITGQEVANVYAESGTRFTNIPVEDIVVLSMAMQDGTPLTHDGSWRQPKSWDFWGDVTMRLIGTKGVLEIDCFDQTLTQTTDIGQDPGIDSVYWGTDMNKELLRDFVTAVSAGEQPEISGQEGVREVQIVEAVYESVESNNLVSIEHNGDF